MKKKKITANKIINQISDARKKNNYNWMNILKLAMQVAPKKTKHILSQINKQDKKISRLVEQISKTKVS